ncbi:MAG: hypothetical protein D6816_08830, partial [Bacteroidetes bacterium]
MKQFLFTLCGILSFTLFLNTDAAGQSGCESAYMPFKQDVFYELTNYDKKGKVTGINRHTISEVVPTANGYKAAVSVDVLDDKEKELTKTSFEFECDGDVLRLDMSAMMDPSVNESLQGMEVELSGDALQIPSKLSPGMELPDAELEIKAMSGGVKIMTIRQSVTDRKVEGTETVTTPAGTFECIKITQTT